MPKAVNVWIIAVAVALVALATWRWHDHAVSAPVLLGNEVGPGFLLVVNERDCPDSPGWLAHWIAPLLEKEIPLRAVIVRSDEAAPEQVRLGGGILLPVTEGVSERHLMKTLARAGVRQTPALLLLDGRGAPTLVTALDERPPASAEGYALALVDLFRHHEPASTAMRSNP